MYAKALFVDRWSHDADLGVETNDPSLDQVRQAVLDLDGEERTLVTVTAVDDTAHLSVGGGSRNQYIVYATVDNQHFKVLQTRLGAQSGQCTLVAGGQAGEYPAEWVVTIDEALVAIETFAKSGVLDAELLWGDQK